MVRHRPGGGGKGILESQQARLGVFPQPAQFRLRETIVQRHEDGAEVEVATFRSDYAYQDGRRPETVRYESDARQDVCRRDFTINALLMDPETREVLDYVEGRADLASRVVRAIGDPETRFAEDHLRMLRAVRFAARLDFQIETGTAAAIRRHCSSIRRVSAERVRDELTRILVEGGARRGLEMLDDTGLLAEVLPEVAAMKGVLQPPEFHPEGDVWVHTLLMLDGMRHPTPELAWGVLLHDVGKPPTYKVSERIRFDGHVEMGACMAVGILTRLRLSNQEIRQVESLVLNHLRFKDLHRMREGKLLRFLRMERFQEHLELHRLDCLSSHRNLSNYEFALRKLSETPPERLRPPRIITGHDLIRMGYRPGPAFAAMLSEVEDALLESQVRTPEEAAAWIQARFEPPGGRRRGE